MTARTVRALLLSVTFALAATAAFAQEAPPGGNPPLFSDPPDLRKMAIEVPTERAIRDSDGRGGAAPLAPETDDRTAATPRIPAKPGLVRWHEDRAAALAAAAESGRPVVVFQMMGDLDDELC